MPQHAINWFEIPVSDFERARKFYSTILEIEMYDMIMGENRMGFFPSEAGSVSGAIVSGKGYEPCTKGSLIYLSCGDDLSNTLGKVVENGGSVLVPKTIISPEYGFYAFFSDTEGNKVGLHSPH
ncbi:VOC family protein [Solitalea koreensis]|nr:VOC family protein [Solitalea koreensis]